MKRSVLFVCMGNICRSPAAEAVLAHRLREEGLGERVRVDSAGTTGYHAGEPSDARMQRTAAERGYRLDGRARRVAPEDFAKFDLVVAMDRTNLAELRERAGAWQGKLRLFSEFLPGGVPEDVPDPYYGGARGFERVLDIVEQGTEGLLEELAGGG